jgi:hypothetical protein
MPAVACVLGLFGLVSLLLAGSRLVAARQSAALGYTLQSALLIAAAMVAWLVAKDLGSYQPRNDARPIADLYFEQVGTRRFRATLTRLPGGRMQVFELAGDAWRLDIRTLDFGGWARAIGCTPGYRLDRLVAVERADAESPGAAATGFALDARDGLDLWQLAHRTGRWRKLITAGHVRSDVLPLNGKSRFELRIAGERVDVRPANSVAEDAPPAEP